MTSDRVCALHHHLACIPLTAEHRTALAWALTAALTQRYVQYATLEYDAGLCHAAHRAALPGPTSGTLPGPTPASATMPAFEHLQTSLTGVHGLTGDDEEAATVQH